MGFGTGFGTKVLEYRTRSEMGQEEFAERVGLHVMHLAKVERGKNNPPGLGTILIMIGVLNLSSSEAIEFLQAAGQLPDYLNISSIRGIKELAESLEVFEAIARAMDVLAPPLKAMKQK